MIEKCRRYPLSLDSECLQFICTPQNALEAGQFSLHNGDLLCYASCTGRASVFAMYLTVSYLLSESNA